MWNNIVDELEWRGLIYQSTPLDLLKERLKERPITLYCGFDPTADSLHIGHLIPILGLRRFQQAGHNVIAVIGGATALLGDPSGKMAERDLNPEELVKEWAVIIKEQLSQYLDFSGERPAQLVNNYDWISTISAFEYLRDIGKRFSVNVMVTKESVKRRLQDPDAGISYTEFSYMIMQAFDYFTLNERLDCELQIGGSDQWGNITAGMDLIWKKKNKKVHCMTFPLISTADGKKIGKTEAGTIWLDKKRTSPYELYQYWLNTDDRDVIKFLKFYTFLSKEEIEELEATHTEDPGRRVAHRKLAEEVTELIHGKEEMLGAVAASKALFGEGEITAINSATFESLIATTPFVELSATEPLPGLVDILVISGLYPSKGQARKDLTGGGIYFNNQRITDPDFTPSNENLIHGKYFVLRKGKKNFKPGVVR
ncbi:MAG: tyrosine--tRNA ligase [Ignavibacteriales bacterium]|nr:MAG: tyrosine--tRNA ligase [Ignavibacteriaceae bacterium]MBW7873243.1 tyrosine--tRNA ligase [Ignavibacteria bacterium]MCZ2142981.1 tyrosine--tRNA ligase [Ignavibacteriales bacterium]OQY72253.1 MAG: tyrosine--tRNA ligase [Ignavibacteriales bacterium UTCHB3]MBV6444668.1 Tyrosine--tRNA ligase [Ignavibacteriaceae bacterium]